MKTSLYLYIIVKLIIFFFIVILEKTIRIPRSLSVKASSVLKGFLNKTPAERLGCNGFFEIVQHGFFKSIDWELVSYLYPKLNLFNILNYNVLIVFLFTYYLNQLKLNGKLAFKKIP